VDLSKYRALFLEEARRLLARAEAIIQGDGPIEPGLTELFRTYHTLKGMSATMQQGPISLLAHAFEDVCDGLVRGRLRADDGARALLAEGLDAFRRQLRAVETTGEATSEPHVERRVREWLRTGAVTEFTLIAREEPAPAVTEEGPAGLRMDRAVGAVAEMLSACQGLRRVVVGGPEIEAELERLEASARLVYHELVELRQVRFGTVVPPLRRHLRSLSGRDGRHARLEVTGEGVAVDQAVLASLQSVLVHLLHNALIHGLEPATDRAAAGKDPVGLVRISLTRAAQVLVLEFSDDGRGLDGRALREAAEEPGGDPMDLAFRAGISTAARVDDTAGRGVGLGVVRSVIERLGGKLSVQNMPGEGLRFRAEVPVHPDLMGLLVVEAEGTTYAIPKVAVEGTEVATSETTVRFKGGSTARVDRIVGSREALVSPPPFPLNRLPRVRGTTVGDDGRILFVLEPLEDPCAPS
jgi:two-component system chemotaxis sensor kinase CheA